MNHVTRNFANLMLFSMAIAVSVSAQVARIPLEIVPSGHAYIKVKVNGQKEPLNFIFDTGATADLLDSTVAATLGIEADYQQEVQGSSGAKSYDIVRNQQISLEGDISYVTQLVLSDLSALNEISEHHIDGIIGYSVLRSYLTKLDFENEQLELYNGISEIELMGYQKISFEFGGGIPIPQFNVSVVQNNEQTITGPIFFDSGAGLTLMVNSPFRQENNVSENAGKSIVTVTGGLSGESTSEEIAIRSIQVGEFVFEDLTVMLSHDQQGVSSFNGYLGILGAEVIRRFDIVLDYRTKQLYLKPNSAFSNKFMFPVSGIKLRKKDNVIVVEQVEPSSPAYAGGLRIGDHVMEINGVTCVDLATCKRMLEREGAEVNLVYRNAQKQVQQITFTLNRLL